MAAAAAKIASSMLSSNYANLASEAERMVCLGADSLHMDVMVHPSDTARPLHPGVHGLGGHQVDYATGSSVCENIFGGSLHVYPGETLVTEMWVDGQRVQYQTKVKEHDCAVLSGYVLLKQHISSSL
ncbi:hypothetical protein ZWY2020_009110 [Hordeum vulgare]|nr:hypothetical protein ZWY2020_009110 [Hordeum vulgare]